MRATLLVLTLALAGSLGAQGSVLSVHGIGFPGRPESARARALGGASAMFDAGSALNPATVALYGRAAASAVGLTDRRSYDIGRGDVSGLRSTRFPLIAAGGRIGTRIGFGITFATYTERSFDITTSDSIMLRGDQVALEDRVSAEGGIDDVRGAASYRLTESLTLGLGIHLLSGSSRFRADRAFADSAYRGFTQSGRATYTGSGLSIGALFEPARGVRLALTARTDADLRTVVDSAPATMTSLPLTLGAGVELVPHPALRWSTSMRRRAWSGTQVPAATTAFDTWEIASGVQVGGPEANAGRFPLRVGARWAQLPFGPTGLGQAREFGVSAGTGLIFAQGRGVIDLAIERASRTGGGLNETSWQVVWGFGVRP